MLVPLLLLLAASVVLGVVLLTRIVVRDGYRQVPLDAGHDSRHD